MTTEIKKEIIQQLHEASNWILEVSKESKEPHIKDMLEGIENAISRLQMNVIEVDIAYYHPNDDETKRVYDEEGMREEFEYKMNCVIKNAGL
jgi:pyrimidine operon attenuation protein/uracil phosphoribosyltransferase